MEVVPLSPSADLVARFGRDLDALAGGIPALGVAVSGGPDSLALLLLAHAALPGRIHAATVDHGLRAGSAREALDVGGICGRLGCPHDILTVSLSDGSEGLQAAARRARYEALAAWAAAHALPCIATAHHVDDQAETLLMRLQRGSGVAGLAGIRPIRRDRGLRIVRPLLGWTRAELAGVVAAAGLDPADDASNRDPRFDRTSARRLLAATPGLDPAALARSAAALGDAEDALGWTADRLWAERIRPSRGGLLLDPDGLPRELLRRLVVRLLAELAPDAKPRGEEIGRLLLALEGGGSATLAGVKAMGGGAWHFAPAPPRRR